MRFIYVGAFRLPNLDAAAPRVLTIGKMLRDNGHSVRYISWGGECDDTLLYDDGHYYVDGFPYEVSNELCVYQNPLKRFSQWITRGKNSLKLIEKADDYDAIIAYQPPLYFVERLKQICKRRGKKLVVDITEWYDNRELRVIDRPLQYYNMTKALKAVKNKILISTHLADYYAGSNNIVIPATSDEQETKWSAESSVTFEPIDGITLIYAGTPSFKDKLSVVVDVVTRLVNEGKKIRFYVFGVTRDQYLANARCDIPEAIVFMGRVKQDDIPGFYRQSDFMVLLRDRTRKNMMGFPTKFTEAVTSGVPIITNDTSDLSQYLKPGINGYYVEEPTEECLYDFLSKEICGMSPDALKALKENARNMSSQLDYRRFSDSVQAFTTTLL